MALIALALSAASGCYAPGHPAVSGRVVEEALHSAAVGDDYRVLVRLPPEYDADPSRRFPVLYQLDAVSNGLDQFHLTAGLVSALEAERRRAPSIVVGIGYFYEDGLKTGRYRDYVFPVAQPDAASVFAPFYGYGGDTFYAFVRDELLPHVDAGYRSDGAPRTLVGHSLGGLFVLYALFQYDPVRNAHFDKFLAASASFDYENGAIFEEEAKLAARGGDLPARLFMAMGALEGVVPNVYFDAMGERLRARAYGGLSLVTQRYAGADHLGDLGAAYADGLARVAP